MAFESKYLKYKNKYLELLRHNQIGGAYAGLPPLPASDGGGDAAGGAGVAWNGIGIPPTGRCIICGVDISDGSGWVDFCTRAHFRQLGQLHADYEDGGGIPDPRVVEYFRRYPVPVHGFVDPVRINAYIGFVSPPITVPTIPAVIGDHVMSFAGLYWGRIVGMSGGNAFRLNNTRIIRRNREGINWQPIHLPAGVIINDVRPPPGPPPYPVDPIYPAAVIGDYVISHPGEVFLGQLERRVEENGGVLRPIPYLLQPYTENNNWSVLHLPPGVTITDNRVAGGGAAGAGAVIGAAAGAGGAAAGGGGAAGGAAAAVGGVINTADDVRIPEVVDDLQGGHPEVDTLIKAIQCPICLLNIKKILICPQGGHTLCSRCTLGLEAGRPCPICRAPIDSRNFKVMHQKYLKY